MRGHTAEIFDFDTTREEEAQILERARALGGCMAGLCVWCSSGAISGVGRFPELGLLERFVPMALGKALQNAFREGRTPPGAHWHPR